MPTSYTEKIINGTDTTFEGFVKRCMRGFGATIHMRDLPLDSDYVEAEPSTEYERQKLGECVEKLEELNNTTDEELKEKEVLRLRYEIKNKKSDIAKKNVNRRRLNKILKKVKEWEPPTSEHNRFKEFMIDQLEQTINFDTNTDWLERGIEFNKKTIDDIESNKLNLRKEGEELLRQSIARYQQCISEEEERVEKRNEWVRNLMKSLEDIIIPLDEMNRK